MPRHSDENGMPEVIVRELSEELIPRAAPLVAQYLWPERDVAETAGHAEANLRRLLAFPAAHLFLAIRADAAVGFAAVHWGFSTRSGQPILHIQDLSTHPQHRRQGVARTLVQHLAVWARAHGGQHLQLVTGTDNAAARALYDALGFEWLSDKEISMRFLG